MVRPGSIKRAAGHPLAKKELENWLTVFGGRFPHVQRRTTIQQLLNARPI